MTQKLNQGKIPTRRQLDAVLVQLRSQRPSDVWRGMDQVRQWLSEDSENRDVYGMLLDAVEENRELREQVRNLLYEMEKKGSKFAHEAMSKLPSGVQDFLVDADDAYYASEYDRAIQLYRQVLKLDPDNAHAKDHIAKAEIKKFTGDTASGLPRAAEQLYRRARSFIAAREVVTAMNLLSAAIDAARAKSMPYPDAEEALNNMNNLLLADDYKQKARNALRNEQWKDALEFYKKALALDPTDDVVRKESYP
jgi:tetratricopeptide (TPR) repeat protein